MKKNKRYNGLLESKKEKTMSDVWFKVIMWTVGVFIAVIVGLCVKGCG